MPFTNKSEARLKRKRQMNKLYAWGQEYRCSFPEDIIYLHNIHKLLWRHITRFVPAFRRRSLPPVCPRGEGTATRRRQLVAQHEEIFAWPVVSLMKNEEQSQNWLLKVDPHSTFRNNFPQPTWKDQQPFLLRDNWSRKVKNARHRPQTSNETRLRDTLKDFVSYFAACS